MFELPIAKCDRLAKGDCPLYPIVLQLQQMVDSLTAQVRALEARNEELTHQLENASFSTSPPPFVKSNRKKGKRRKKPGRKKGHPGSGRKRPDNITETVEHCLATCPCCGEPLNEGDILSTHDHVQEDIVPAQVNVTLYRHRRYRCPKCGVQSETVAEGDEIPKAKLGPRVLLVAALYKYDFCLPFRKIARMLNDTCGLKVSHGALQKGVERLAAMMQGEFDALLHAIRAGPSVNVDETGWHVDGIDHWLWAFVNHHYTLYQINRHRSNKIPLKVLGKDYDGVVVSDFYSGYNPLPYEKQKCHVHLLRELHEVGEKNDSDEFHRFKKKLTRLLSDSVRLAERRDTLAPGEFSRRKERLKTRLRNIAIEVRTDKDAERLRKRLLKHENEMLTFLDHPGLDKDNNRAERAIRPNVVIRKISGGNRSDAGADTHSTLMSLIATTSQQGKDWFQEGKRAIQNHRDGSSQTVLT